MTPLGSGMKVVRSVKLLAIADSKQQRVLQIYHLPFENKPERQIEKERLNARRNTR
jgi:hypothetical protein